MDFINSRTRTITEMALDGLYERQKALASNTANVLTPNYQRKDVEFEAQIQHAIKMADEREQERLQNSKMFVEKFVCLAYNLYSDDTTKLEEVCLWTYIASGIF